MTALASGCTVTPITPAECGKCLLIKTASTATASDTIDVSTLKPALTTIYFVSPIVGATGAGASCTWSGTTITFANTMTTAVAYLVVWGTD